MRRYLVVLLFVMSMAKSLVAAEQPIDIDSRLELFVDHYLIDEMSGDAQLQLHKPTPKDVVLVTDEPWEGNTCAYYTVFQDGDLFRMYYRGAHFDVKARKSAHRELACYAESKDGIQWTKPELGAARCPRRCTTLRYRTRRGSFLRSRGRRSGRPGSCRPPKCQSPS